MRDRCQARAPERESPSTFTISGLVDAHRGAGWQADDPDARFRRFRDRRRPAECDDVSDFDPRRGRQHGRRDRRRQASAHARHDCQRDLGRKRAGGPDELEPRHPHGSAIKNAAAGARSSQRRDPSQGR
jgi:hypothetical protein